MVDREVFEIREDVTLVGLGRLQLGLVGPVLSNLGYNLLGVSLTTDEVAERLRTLQCYRISSTREGNPYFEVPIVDAELVDCGKPAAEARLMPSIARSTVLNLALGSAGDADQRAAEFLLLVLAYRRDKAIVKDMFVTCSDNPSGREFAVTRVLRKFIDLTLRLPDEEREAIWNDVPYHVHFVKTLADRICTHRIIPRDRSQPVQVVAETYGRLTFDSSFEETQPIVLKAGSVRELATSSNMEIERQKKLYTLSMAHSVAAYLGLSSKSEPKTIREAMDNPDIELSVRHALDAVAKALGGTGEGVSEDWASLAQTTYRRLLNSDIDDGLQRVARDVPRKLGLDDRILGPLEAVFMRSFSLCEPLLNAAAGALTYAARYGESIPQFEDDPSTVELGKRLRRGDVEDVISTILGTSMDAGQHLTQMAQAIMGRYDAFLKRA